MMMIHSISNWTVDAPDGSVVSIKDLPQAIAAVLLIEALAYDIIAALPFAERAGIGRHLGDIGSLLQSSDPLQYRRTAEPAWAQSIAGRA